MLLKTKGKAFNFGETIVGRVTYNENNSNPDNVLISDTPITKNFGAVLSKLPFNQAIKVPIVTQVQTFEHLKEGDIIQVNSDGIINTLYRANSYQNFIFATDRCNSNCLMCSQPPKDKEDVPFRFKINKKLVALIPKDCCELGITGGEPTLMGNLFFDLLEQIKNNLPETEIHCLSNGRTFAWKEFADKLGSLEYDRLMLGIPVYSDYYLTHDYIVQAKNAWYQTMQGLYNLAQNNIRIEIRVVLHKITIPRLVKLAKYICKNLPFVEHVALMGLEFQGYTPHNIEKLWIDPVNYMNELQEACDILSDFGLNVSIYNTQLCLMPKDLWKYNKKSISDWKNIYLDECSKCTMVSECGGLFASGLKKHSEYIKAFDKLEILNCELQI